MPVTKRESLYFGMMMCFGMVVVMTFYNLATQNLIGELPAEAILSQIILGFSIALMLELFIVGPAARKMAFSLPFNQSKKGLSMVVFSIFMVIGMVLCMSVYGLLSAAYYHSPAGESLWKSYASIAAKNAVFALPVQLIIIGPLVRYLFSRLFKRTAEQR